MISRSIYLPNSDILLFCEILPCGRTGKGFTERKVKPSQLSHSQMDTQSDLWVLLMAQVNVFGESPLTTNLEWWDSYMVRWRLFATVLDNHPWGKSSLMAAVCWAHCHETRRGNTSSANNSVNVKLLFICYVEVNSWLFKCNFWLQAHRTGWDFGKCDTFKLLLYWWAISFFLNRSPKGQ